MVVGESISDGTVGHDVRADRRDHASMVVECKSCKEARSVAAGDFDGLHEFMWRHFPKSLA